MPELPEVETMRRGILPIVGSRVVQLHAPRGRCRPILIRPALAAMTRRIGGQAVTAVDRLGKRVVLRFPRDESLVFEPRMTGLVLVSDPPDTEHLRFGLELAGGPVRHVWYWDLRGLGSVRLLNAGQFESELGSDRLGPDALAVTRDELRDRFAERRRPIKVALLDQQLLAGVGNLYASEVLHLARVHPERSCDRITAAEWQRLHAALREVLEEAVRYEGSTLSDGTYRNALNQSGGYQNHHRVYDRAGETCPSCGRGEIRRIVQAQRSTFFCPKCQTQRK